MSNLKITHNVCIRKEYETVEDGQKVVKASWPRVGNASPTKTGNGYKVNFDFVPLKENGSYHTEFFLFAIKENSNEES